MRASPMPCERQLKQLNSRPSSYVRRDKTLRCAAVVGKMGLHSTATSGVTSDAVITVHNLLLELPRSMGLCDKMKTTPAA
jgi:hypothetical protein